MKIKIIFIIGGLIIILSVILYINIKDNKYYETDYYAKMLLDKTSTFKEIKSIYGEPNEVVVEKHNEIYSIEANFNDFTALFFSSEPEIKETEVCESLWIYSDVFKFGKDELCVGSTKEEVNNAYLKCKKAKKVESECTEVKGVFFDNHIHITYHYNKEYIVEKIVYYYYY